MSTNTPTYHSNLYQNCTHVQIMIERNVTPRGRYLDYEDSYWGQPEDTGVSLQGRLGLMDQLLDEDPFTIDMRIDISRRLEEKND